MNRFAGHRSAAHAQKLTSSSSSAVRCSTPVTSQGRAESCSVTVNENERTNICSHEGSSVRQTSANGLTAGLADDASPLTNPE